MKFAIISDTHFGDDNCTLVSTENDKVTEGPKYVDFKKAAGTGNKYLILAGDILDFSIASYEKAYRYGQFFFQKVKDDDIADEMIYLAGNHVMRIYGISFSIRGM
jgi:DNA repair exonuclease SbcCD nuclease subunit